MKIYYKLTIGYFSVALLAGLSGYSGLIASKKILDLHSTYNEDLKDVVHLTAKASGFAKRAEGHLMLFLNLNKEEDKKKFYARHASLIKTIDTLDKLVFEPQMKKSIKNLQSEAEQIFFHGQKLIDAYYKDRESTGNFDLKRHRDLILAMHKASRNSRRLGSDLTRTILLAEDQRKVESIRTAHLIHEVIKITVGGAIILALLFGYFNSKYITSPIKKMKRVAQKIAEGNLNLRINIHSKDEIEDLAHSFNEMANSLIQAKEKAEINSRAKSELLSRISHEFRTPMNSVLGFAQLLDINKNSTLDKIQRDHIKQILNSGQHLLDLINNVLDLTKTERDEYKFECEILSLKPLIDDLVVSVRPLAEAKGITIENQISSTEEFFINANRTHFKQIVLNLLSNSIKFNKDKGSIFINLKNIDDSNIELSVRDTGRGIPKDMQNKIFDPLQRERDDATIEGTGLGLSITKQLVELMKGSIYLESDQGKGATFFVTFNKSSESQIKGEISG